MVHCAKPALWSPLLSPKALSTRDASQDIDAVYFGDGAVNDLEDWSNFLEVPDFMASFSSSEVRSLLQDARI
jgi:hypothetical protein